MQLALFDEHHLYHQPDRYGFFAIRSADSTGVMRERSYPLPRLDTVLQLLPRDRDSQLSQAEFVVPNRRIVNLARVGLLFVDMDCYKLNLLPEQAMSRVLFACDDHRIPYPSIVIHSGRGIYAKWILKSALPRHALPRWNRVQSELVRALSFVGADAGAKDASRVLRIVGTVNTKSGEICRVLRITPCFDGQPIRYDFEYLCDRILPLSRRDLERERKEPKERPAVRLVHSGSTSGLHRFSGRQLAWHRLEDLRRLAELRGGVQEGWRMLFMFWSLNFLLLSGATNSQQMFHEAKALAHEIGFLDGWSLSDLGTLYRKAKDFESGKRIEHDGREYPPLYTPRNQTLLDVFKITPGEERQLRTIVSEDVAAERHRERETERRRAAGASDRQTYEANSLSRQKPWEELGVSRATWYRMQSRSASEA